MDGILHSSGHSHKAKSLKFCEETPSSKHLVANMQDRGTESVPVFWIESIVLVNGFEIVANNCTSQGNLSLLEWWFISSHNASAPSDESFEAIDLVEVLEVLLTAELAKTV